MRSGSPRERAVGVLALTMAAGVGVALLILFCAMPAQAIVPERPTVELVKVFKCWAESSACPDSIEHEANVWLKSIQPSGRILERKLKVTSRHIVLVFFYKVLESRTKEQPAKVQPNKKLPAEAP